MSKKSPTPKFVNYDKDTPFRAEGVIIYGPIRQKNATTGEIRISKYENFICECENEVQADAFVFLLNDAWQTGKMHGENNNPTKIGDYDGYINISDIIKNKNYPEVPQQYKGKVKGLLPKEEVRRTESGKKIMEEGQEKLKQFKKLEEAKFIEKTPGWYEQKWDD
jgi:hypothetical protein